MNDAARTYKTNKKEWKLNSAKIDAALISQLIKAAQSTPCFLTVSVTDTDSCPIRDEKGRWDR